MLSINNAKIYEFYRTHPQYNIESMNLILLDLIEECTFANMNDTPHHNHNHANKNDVSYKNRHDLLTHGDNSVGNHSLKNSMIGVCNTNVFIQKSGVLFHNLKINELVNTFTTLKSRGNEFNKHFIQFFINAKNDYINEFRTISTTSVMELKERDMKENNKKIVDKLEGIIDLLKIHSILNTDLHSKMEQLSAQFKQLIESNANVIIDINYKKEIVDEFCMNFEINMSNMSMTFQTILNEYIEDKKNDVEKMIESINKYSYMLQTNNHGNDENMVHQEEREVVVVGNGTGGILPPSISLPNKRDNTEMKHINSQYSRLMYELNNMIQFMNIKTYIGKNSSSFELALTQMYPTASMSKDTELANKISYLLYREQKNTVYIENMYVYDRNLNHDEIKDFIGKMTHHNANGIFISHYTGIMGKSNFYIEIVDSHVAIFIHHLEKNPERIKHAMEILDTMSCKLNDFYTNGGVVSADTNVLGGGGNNVPEKIHIPKEIMDDINREYQMYIMNKENIISYMKESHKKLLGQVEDIKFPSLDRFLATKYSPLKKQDYTCNLCHCFSVGTLKGLAAHKRGCMRKLGLNTASLSGEMHTNNSYLQKDTHESAKKSSVYAMHSSSTRQ
jgi:hypothetical protein